MRFFGKKIISVLFLSFFVLFFSVSIPVQAKMAIFDDLVSQGVSITTLDDKQMDQQRAKGSMVYLNLRPGGGLKFIRILGGLHHTVGTKMENIVTGIASETTTHSPENIYLDNYTKKELWRHNTSTNALNSSRDPQSTIIHWSEYRPDGGFTYFAPYGQFFGLSRSAGPGAYATHYIYK